MSQEAAPAAAATAPPPHVLPVCYPSQDHVNPTLRFTKRLAAKGLLVTCCTTSGAGAQIAAAASSSPGVLSSGRDGDSVPVGLGRVRFKFLDDRGNEKDDLMRYFAMSAPAAFAELLGRQAAAGRPVACVVGNPFRPWSCAVFSIYYHYARGLVELPPEDDPEARVALPGFPPLSTAEVPSFLLPSNPLKLLAGAAILGQFRSIDRASWVFVNSFSELERGVLAELPGVTPRPPQLIPVGPLIELEEDGGDAVRGDMFEAADDFVGWLDTQAPRSVAYASVGSVVVLSAEEVAEMAHGLASTDRPFLWVVRSGTRPLLPEGFLDAVAGRGVVVPWCLQERLQAHAATACFLTHCGWSSTLETVAAGVPVVAFPQWGDQCTDAKFLVEELGMGVVREAVDAAVAGPEADSMRARARSWSAVARAAVAAGGSLDRNVQAFVDEVMRRASGRQATDVTSSG
ncbi:hypothetical protein GQ55_5G486100 [Panicum hallii var. hallii]|uniref:Glycosyltransferase n=1 Tax=Panicum hallii var. hallii TaxID=1504633 RepID=A0A2T7DRF0_9POAL|nr:hypothetical protein GQ55_5G486100 [Panicum hallii var. hallii]